MYGVLPNPKFTRKMRNREPERTVCESKNQTGKKKGRKANSKYLHQLLDHIPAKNMIKHRLQELIPHDGELQLVSVPDENPRVFNGRR